MNVGPLFGAYEQRVLVFMEEHTYDGFRQVYLNKDQFKRVNDAICSKVPPEEMPPDIGLNMEVVMVRKDAGRIVPEETFEGMNSVNEP